MSGVSPTTKRLAPLALPLLLLAACNGDDDNTDVPPSMSGPGTAPVGIAPTPTAPPGITEPSFTTPASVYNDTNALGGTSVSTVDLTTGAATALGTVGDEVGVLGMAVSPDGGTLYGVTDTPTFLQLDVAALATPIATVDLPADGTTLLALAARRSDGALFSIADDGSVVHLDSATGDATPVAERLLDDPGVGLDVRDDGTLELVTATGGHVLINPETGEMTDAAPITARRIVAIAHNATQQYGIDADADELVTIGDDGTVTTVGPLGIDVTDGASFDIAADGTAYLTSPG